MQKLAANERTTVLDKIVSSVLILLNLYDNLSAIVKRYCKRAITHMCRHFEYFQVPFVSEAAYFEAERRGISDLRAFDWDNQVSKLSDKGRKVFHWEHAMPVSDMVQALLRGERTQEAVSQVLSSVTVAWITKEEDRRLPRANRADHEACYRHAGIQEHRYD